MSDQTERDNQLQLEDAKQKREARLKILDDQIHEASLYAQWWMASATTGHAATRTIFKVDEGGERRKMTKEELTSEAMQTAHRHIERHRELYEARAGFARNGHFE